MVYLASTLTTSIETVNLGASGTADGVINGANGTYQTGDTINGSSLSTGSSVNVTIAAASGEANGPLVALNNIGSANFRTLAAAPVNAQLFTNVATVASASSTNVLTVNSGALATTYALRNTVSGSVDGLAIGIRAGDVTGTSNTANFSVSSVGTANTAALGAASNLTRSLLSTTTSGIENIAIATTGSNFFTLTGNTTAATDSVLLTITGTGTNNISIGAGGLATTSTINAATATGALTLNVGTNLTTGDTIVGGTATTDTLQATIGGTVSTGLAVSAIETLRIGVNATGATNGGSLAFTTNPGFTTVRIDAVAAAGAAGAAANQLLNAGGFTTLNFVGNSTTASATAANNFNGVSVSGGYTGAADTLTVNLGNAGVTLLAGGSYAVGNTGIATSGVESYVVNVNDQTANTVTATLAAISDASMTSLKAVSTGNVVFTNVGNIVNPVVGFTGSLSSIDMTGVTGTNAVSSVTVANDSMAAAATVLAGAGGLTLVVAAETATDVLTLTGGIGADTLTAATFVGNIIANGGAGVDTFTIGAAASSALTGGTGGDTFTLNQANIFATITDLGVGASVAGVETLTIGNAAGGVTATVAANFIDANGGTDTAVMSFASAAANNVFNLNSAIVFTASGSAGAGGVTVNANAAGAVTITGTGNADVLNGGAGVDTLVGGAGADVITAGAGTTNTINGGTAADTMTGGAGVDTFVLALGDSVVRSASTLTALVAAGDSVTFATGAIAGNVDRIIGFTAGAGGDILDLAAGGPAQALLGANAAALAAGTNYFLSGNYNATTGVFTVTANGAGADTLIAQGAAAPNDSLVTDTSVVILTGVNSANLVAANII